MLEDFNCHYPLWDSRGTSDPRGEEVFHWVISSDLLPLNDHDTSTLLHRSPDISFAPFTLAFSCYWEVLQDLGSDHLPILLSVPLSPVFRPNERPPSFNFQKARWDSFASHFDCHYPSAEKYLSLSSAAAFFTSLALKADKSSISFARIKHHPKAWWSAEVESAVSERRKAFAAAHRSDEDRQVYISASRRASQSSPRLRHGRRLALFFHLNLNTPLRSIAGSSSSSTNFPNCSSPRESASVYAANPRPHFSVSQPEATSLSSAEPRSLRSLTRPFALLFVLLNFLRALQPLLVHRHWPRQSCLSYAKASSSLWHGFSSSHFQSLLVFTFLSFHPEDIFYYSHTQDGKSARLSCFLPAYLFHLLRFEAF